MPYLIRIATAVFIALVLGSLLAPTASLQAQDIPHDELPDSHSTAQLLVGAEAGMTLSSQQGGEPLWQDSEAGVGSVGSITLEYRPEILWEGLALELKVGYEEQNVDLSYMSRFQEVIGIGDPNGSGETSYARVILDYQNTGRMTFQSAQFAMGLKQTLVAGLYVGAGIDAGLTIGAETEYTRKLRTNPVLVEGFGLMELNPDSFNRTRVREHSDTEPLVMGVHGMLGYSFTVGRYWDIGPRINYRFPVTASFESGARLHTVAFTLGVQYVLN